MADAGDAASAERLLDSVAKFIDIESNGDILRQYAEACHNWGPPEAEEAALRALFRQRRSLDVIESLLGVLQQKLNNAAGEVREMLLNECIALGTEALRLVQPGSGLTWANLVSARGLHHLDKVRLGHREHTAKAQADIEAYLSWLKIDESVPNHLQRANLIALTKLDMGELLIFENRREEAAQMIEDAIQHLESAKAFTWMLDRAYSLLERAID